MPSNRLLHEKSPYLLQHAHNPVDWYAWGEEAFAKARREDKPIFLSVGYATCHWCHVMERESFENERIAGLLNEHFVSIKVDREERPDIDRIYMTALQAMGQSGGWPMSMFLTPDLRPFYGGTYFPPESRYGRAGLPDILNRIRQIWVSERDKVEESARGLLAYLTETAQAAGSTSLPGVPVLDLCYEQLRRTYDEGRAGFGRGSKFPRPVALRFLLRYYHRARSSEALSMVVATLQAMAAGGLRDHIGGGFHRYTVDADWRVPHFEKMLYDQAQLVQAYLDAFQITRDPLHESIIRSTMDYVLRDMTLPEGAFCSAEDADSPIPEQPEEHGEGAFYLWKKEEILKILGEGDGRLFSLCYGVQEEGNAPFDPQQEFVGKNILYVAESASEVARTLGKPVEEVESALERARAALLAVRSSRPRPLRDDKVLTSWNGLMIGASARAGAVLDEPRYREAAERSAGFLLSHLKRPDGGLYRRYRQGEARFDGHLDDYAFLSSGLLDLYEASASPRWLGEAAALTERTIADFHDRDHDGFFENGSGDPSVLVRLKEHYDGAEPTGNSAMAANLARLGALTGREDWQKLAERTVAAFANALEKQPVALPNMASSLDMLLAPAAQVVVVGKAGDLTRQAMLRQVFLQFLPSAVVVAIDPAEGERSSLLHPDIQSLPMQGGKATAYICRNFRCSLPTGDPATVAAMLAEKEDV